MDFDLDLILPRVQKPARYTGGEWNAVHKDHASARVRFALSYPDIYEVGMSHLGLQVLYHILNAHPDYLAERCFAPWPDMEQELRSRGLPLFSLESRTPLREFDAIGITLPYELTYTNVLNMLDLAGIPVRAADRSPEHPLIIGGGPGAVNPEPLAEFFDAILIGEGEEAILEIAEAAAQKDRAAALDALAAIEGVYVPSRFQYAPAGPGPRGAVTPVGTGPARVTRRIVTDLDAAPFPTHQIVPFIETVHARVTLEIMRGCTRGCRFCQAHASYSAAAHTQRRDALAAGGRGDRRDGLRRDLTAGVHQRGSSRYRGAGRAACGPIRAQGVGVALPSLRVDAFSVALANKIQ